MTTPLKVLVDAGVGKAVEDWLRQSGHDLAAVRDRDPHMQDDAILAWAVQEQRLVMTMDKDFGELGTTPARLTQACCSFVWNTLAVLKKSEWWKPSSPSMATNSLASSRSIRTVVCVFASRATIRAWQVHQVWPNGGQPGGNA